MVGWLLSGFMFAAVGSGASDCTILHFTASWCQPCQQMAPDIARLKREGWNIQSVDVDSDRAAVANFRIQNLPTLVITSGGREVDRIVGASSYDVIARRAARVAARGRSSSTGQQFAAQPQAPPAQRQVTAQPVTAQPQLAAQGQVAAPGPIVRGQSPGLNSFPRDAAQVANNLLPRSVPQAAPAATMQSPTLSPEQAIARAAAATVRIRVDEPTTTAFGTGTIVDVHGNEALVLTCGHLFRHMTPGSQLTIDLYTPSGMQTLPARLIDFKADGEDIGLISFVTPFALEPVDLLPRGEKPSVGQPAFSFGCDHGDDPTRRDTQIIQVDRYLGAANIEIRGAPAVGRSGGGLFDLQGRLIGVCNAADATDDEGIYAAAEVVYSQIARLGLDHLFEHRPSAPVQLASAQTATPQTATPQLSAPQSQPPVAPAGGQWPSDSEVQNALVLAGGSQAAAGVQPNAAGSPTQLVCIVRDASGVERTVTIDRPSPQLLSTIQQHSQR